MKIYQTRLGNLSTSVDVNGVPRRVQFTGGITKRVKYNWGKNS